MVELARRHGLGVVRGQARHVVLGAEDPEDAARARRGGRSLRHWVDTTGMVRLSAYLVPEVGQPLLAAVDALAHSLRRNAQVKEPFEAHAADALVALLSGQGAAKVRTVLNLVVDISAYRRGHAHPGEVSAMVGGPPLTVSDIRRMAADAFIKAVIHDGVKVRRIWHQGRHLPATLRTALELGAPPSFEGATCAQLGCGRRHGLQWDHVGPVANCGPTSYDNLQPLCYPHHSEKTERDRRAGLLGPRGQRSRRRSQAPPTVSEIQSKLRE